MSELNFKDFLTSGCFLQVSQDLFKLMWGPFVKSSISASGDVGSNTFLYRPKFWDFLNADKKSYANCVYLPSKSIEVSREEFIGLLRDFGIEKLRIVWKPLDAEAFREQFKWGQSKISSGELKKLVPIIRRSGEGDFGLKSRAYCILNLLESESFGWSYGYFDQSECVIGKTPESLMIYSKNSETNEEYSARSMALAGTFPNTEEGLKKIIVDQKTRQEHNWVINDIDEKSSDVIKKIFPTEVMRLKHLLHLKTDFNFKLSNESEAILLAERLHPTAAMGVYPNKIELLSELSKFKLQSEREYFAAPLGIIEKGLVHIVVAIRCLRVSGQHFMIDSGCGITADSQFEAELIELQNKRESVIKMLGIAND